jgi:hypothetical protein
VLYDVISGPLPLDHSGAELSLVSSSDNAESSSEVESSSSEKSESPILSRTSSTASRKSALVTRQSIIAVAFVDCASDDASAICWENSLTARSSA